MSSGRGRILVVDDDLDFRESVATYLRAQGFQVTEASDGAEGLELARRHPPDLVLLDIMMRERTEGFFTLQELRRDPALAGVPVFVVSSLYEDVPGFRIRPERSWLKHDEFLPKPLDFDVLLERVTLWLEPSVETP